MDLYLAATIVISASIVCLAATKILPKITNFESNRYKSMRKLDDDYIKQLEQDNQGLKAELKSKIAQENRRQRGPEYAKDTDWTDLVSMFAGDISQFLPRKLQPLFQDKELQNGLISKIMENPEKFKPLINKFLKSDTQEKQDNVIDAV